MVSVDPTNPTPTPPGGPQVAPPGALVPPPGGEVPPEEVLKAFQIVNVEGMGYIEAPQGPNGTITMVLVDPVASARKWSHK